MDQFRGMTLDRPFIEHLEGILARRTGGAATIRETFPVGGGSINDAWRLETRGGRFFLKTNDAAPFPDLFEAEADGLGRLRGAAALRVPGSIAHGEERDTVFLLLEWIESAPRSASFWEDFGRGLARLHRHTWQSFGLERDNRIGSLAQVNSPEADWASFLIRHRLEPQLRMARDHKRVEAGTAFRFERLFGKLGALFPIEPPALLHGDLWSGNFLAGPSGEPVLIDPATYYGHREMDLAMTRLFGGFDPRLYAAYHAEWPLERGWEERMDLCNLYPLLVHVNLFGGGYAAQVEGIIRRFV